MTDPATASPGDVFARERQEHIARIVEEHGRVRVNDLAAQFRVSSVTIRKDLVVLESERRLVRTHGGAIAVDRSRPELPFDIRERLQADEKGSIGAAGAALVQDGESIVMDASTTALSVARQLKARGGWSQLTVITNGLRLASELAGHPGIVVLMLGGRVRWEALSVVGQLGDGLFSRVNVQKAFLGAAGFTVDSGLADATEEEAQIKRSMVAAAREVIAIVDHTQVGARRVRDVLLARRDQPRADRPGGTGRHAPGARWPRRRGPPGRPGRGRDPWCDTPIARGEADVVTVPTVEPGGVAANRIPADGDAPRVELDVISKRFAATQALDGVSLVLRAGEIRALVGENGAGKSTLVKILAGVHQPDSGTMSLDGSPTLLRGPADARARGIAVVHQEPRLFPDLSVAENVFIGHAPTGRFGSISWREMRRQATRCSRSSTSGSTSGRRSAACRWRTSS